MRCDECEVAMKGRETTTEAPYSYDIGGLPSVGLVGITIYTCPTCREESPLITKPAELHRVIAQALLRKPEPLSGEELRFLRKNAGFPAQKFAALLGIDPAHLSRVENGKVDALGPSTDRLARAVVMAAAKGGEDVRKMLLEHADTKQDLRRRPLFKLEKNRWRHAA